MKIYKITNLINGKIYIGQTSYPLNQRLNRHFIDARSESRNERAVPYLHRAMLKYGKDSFTIEEVDSAKTMDELLEKEIHYIKHFSSNNREIGYNLTTGGESGNRGESTRQLTGEKKKQNWQDPKLAEKMMAGLEKATKEWQKICRENRVLFTCPECGEKEMLPPHLAKSRKYCSHRCAGLNSSGLQVANKKTKKKRDERNLMIQEFARSWALENKESILVVCPKSHQVGLVLTPLREFVIKEFQIKDWRSISSIICGKPQRSELLVYLQDYVKMYAELTGNCKK